MNSIPNLKMITCAIMEQPVQAYFLRLHATAMERQCNTPLNAFQSYVTSKNLIHVEPSFLEPLAGAPSLIQRLRVTSQDDNAPFLPASDLQSLIWDQTCFFILITLI